LGYFISKISFVNMTDFFLLLLGLGGLVIGAQLIIKGALNISRHYKISEFFIGLTVLAIGSDLPELVVHVTGAIHKLNGVDTSGLIIGETIGTCMSQIALALGIIGLFSKIKLGKKELVRDGSMMLGSVALIFFVGFDGLISRTDGVVLITIYILYFINLFRDEGVFEKFKWAGKIQFGWSILSLMSGLFILIYSSNLVIVNAVSLAEVWGVSQSLVGALILGFGTSLPEITLSIAGLRSGAIGLTVGNLIGSNIYDAMFTLGIGASIAEFNFENNLLMRDLPILFITSLIVLIFFAWKRKLKRVVAVSLIAIYIAYVAFKLGMM